MDIAALLDKFQAVPRRSEWRAKCPYCQPDQQDSSRWSVRLAPGHTRPVLVLCVRCGRMATEAVLRHYNVTVADLGQPMPSDEIQSLWADRLEYLPQRAALDPALLHAVYDCLLRHPLTRLQSTHRDWLALRGFEAADVDRFFYGSIRNRDKNRIASDLYLQFRDSLLDVPGFLAVEGVPTICGGEGILTPCRHLDGTLGGIKIRQIRQTPKCLLMSSGQFGGPRGQPVCHVPLGKKVEGSRVVILEGERNADFCSLRLPWPVLAVPGVRCWRLAVPVLQSLGATEILLGFDQDKAGWKISLDLAEEMGYPMSYLKWEGAKGLDDWLWQEDSLPEVVEDAEEWLSFVTDKLEDITV